MPTLSEMLASQQMINENIEAADTKTEAEKKTEAAAKRKRTKKKTLESRATQPATNDTED